MSPQRQERGDLGAFITAHKATLPGEGSNAYVDPTPSEATRMAEAIALAQAGHSTEAAAVLDALGYDQVQFEDVATSTWHLMLRERDPSRRGWGLCLLRLAPEAADVTIEVPHPIWDTVTPELGIESYLRLRARHFLMAGAHRYANGPHCQTSDMARNPNSMFHQLHRTLPGPATHVVQFHGFNRQNHPDYPNAVLSNGSPEPHPELLGLQVAIEARGETAGVFDGQRWARLGATRNPQGLHTRSIGGRFYHIELRHIVRAEPTRRASIVEALFEALSDNHQ